MSVFSFFALNSSAFLSTFPWLKLSHNKMLSHIVDILSCLLERKSYCMYLVLCCYLVHIRCNELQFNSPIMIPANLLLSSNVTLYYKRQSGGISSKSYFYRNTISRNKPRKLSQLRHYNNPCTTGEDDET